jgi:hypothetical protein
MEREQMNITKTQADARRAYANGAVGVAVSGAVWTMSGLIALSGKLETAMLVLFIGGMAINPLSQLIVGRLLKLEPADKENSLIWLGLLTVPVVLLGMYAGYVLSAGNPAAFFAFTLMAIGARYLVFQTMFGLPHYIVLGLSLLAVGFATFCLSLGSAAAVALIGGAIELAAALTLSRVKA